MKYRPKSKFDHGRLINEYAALALIRSLPDYFLDNGQSTGRVNGLLEKLRGAVDSVIELYPLYDELTRVDIAEKIEAFRLKAFGRRGSKHIITMICFTLELTEAQIKRNPWPAGGNAAHVRFVRERGLRRCISVLTRLFDHYERDSKNAGMIPLCIDGGRNMARQWDEVANGAS